jgi:hypothetical protein
MPDEGTHIFVGDHKDYNVKLPKYQEQTKRKRNTQQKSMSTLSSGPIYGAPRTVRSSGNLVSSSNA